jgi:hypothetical protein
MRFSSFLDKKTNEMKRQLKIIKDIVSESELKVEESLDHKEPYLFVSNSEKGLDFGVRIYKVGSEIAYRIQRRKDTQPYGEAYPLNLESGFADLISDMSQDDAAEKIKKAVVNDIKLFFKKSSEANNDLLSSGANDGTGRIIISSGNGDLSNSM